MAVLEKINQVSRVVTSQSNRLIRRSYLQWSKIVATYPLHVVSCSLLVTMICAISFFVKTPFTIGVISADKVQENVPKAFVLQARFSKKKFFYYNLGYREFLASMAILNGRSRGEIGPDHI